MKSKQYNYNNIKYGFYDKIFHKKKGVRSAWHHIKFNFIKRRINKNNSHLDIGCGSGTFISLLKNRFAAGIDISFKQITYAKKIYGSKTKKFIPYKKEIPFKPNTFNSVSLLELIEHLNDINYELYNWWNKSDIIKSKDMFCNKFASRSYTTEKLKKAILSTSKD